MNSNIYALPVFDRWLLRAPLADLDALVNEESIERLKSGEPGGPAELEQIRWSIANAALPPQPKTGEVAPDFLGFITTRACNIGCVYCDFGGATAKKLDLDPEVAVSAIDWYADHLVRVGRRQLKVHLFGGEPFHAPEAVDLIIHRTRAVCAQRDLTPWFEVSTNGVFNDSRAKFVGDYLDVVVLSFDGPPEFHDRNRPAFDGKPTFAVVERTARRLSQLPVELCLRACVTDESVEHMPRITEWMCREFQPTVINHEPLTLNELTRRAGLSAPDPFAFAVNWMKSRRTAAKYGVHVVYSASEAPAPQLSSCPVGSDTMIVSPDGRASACYMLPEDWQSRGMDFDMAWVRPGGQVSFDTGAVNNVRQLVADKPRCEKCFCRWSCAGGCHVTHSFVNCSLEYDDFCLQTRIITACLALERLGADDLADALLADRAAMRRLATHPLDCIELQPSFCGTP